MLKYIFKETLRGLRRKYTLLYIGGMLILCILANIAFACFRAMYINYDGGFSGNLIIFAEGVFVIPYYAMIFLDYIVFGPGYPNPFIKNSLTKKLHRWQLYIGKLVSAFLISVCLFIVSFAMLIGVTTLFSMNDGTIDAFTLTDFMQKSMLALPLWVAGMSIAMMFLFAFPNKKKAAAGFYVVVLIIPRLIMFLAREGIDFAPCVKLRDILITPEFYSLQYFFTQNPTKCWILGIVYSVISTAIGMFVYYRKKNFTRKN